MIPVLGRFSGEGIGYPFQYSWASLVTQKVKNPPEMRKIWVQTMGWREAGMGKSERESCSVVSDSLRPHGPYSPWNSPVEFHYGVGSLSILQGIFPTQGLKPDLPHCRWILYQLSHQGSPRILEWRAYPSSRGCS